MGSLSSSSFYLSDEELHIIASTNPVLTQYFISVKNYQGYITSAIFYSKIMNKAVDKKISDKVFKRFSYKGCMSNAQLKYYYCALSSMNNLHKIAFITYLIFGLKAKISLSTYSKKVLYFFSQSSFLNSFLTSKVLMDNIASSGMADKEKFHDILSLNQKKFNSFFFIKQYTTYENNTNAEYEYICYCDDKYEEKNKEDIKPFYNQMYDQFETIKESNGGFYPLSLLNRLLLDVHVNEKIANLIIRYIQKTMKNFIDYETFYTIISSLPPSRSVNSLEYLFNILAYPNDNIKKNTLLDIITSIQIDKGNHLSFGFDNNTSSKTPNCIDDQVLPEIITLKDFISYGENGQFEEIDAIKNNIDRISLIPYLFFNIPPGELAIESACIENIMKGRTIDQYMKEQFLLEDTFYAVPSSFWRQYTAYLSAGELPNRPMIDTKEISSEDNPLQLNSNALYRKHYCLLPGRLNAFVTKLCPKRSNEIVIRKISYPKKEASLIISLADFSYEKDNIITELELIPINMFQFSFYYITLSLDNPDIAKVKEFLSLMMKYQKGNAKLCSRMTSLLDVKRELMIIYEYNAWETSDLIIFYGEEFIRLPNETLNEKTFDSLNISEACVCLLNTKHESFNYTYFDSICEKGVNLNQQQDPLHSIIKPEECNDKNYKITVKKEVSINESSSSFPFINYLALENMKNSCYINSVLQLIYSFPILQLFIRSKFFTMLIKTKTEEERDKMITFQLFKMIIEHDKKIKLNKGNQAFLIQPLSFLRSIETISNFRREQQEDAGEFLNFIINQIHQEIKLQDVVKQEPEYHYNIKLSDEDNISIIWGKEIKNNTSLINSLFLFLNQTVLTCTKCKAENKKCQTANNLFLPIPKDEIITVSIILHRLPFKYKVYKGINNKDEQIGQNQIEDMLSSMKENMIDSNVNTNADIEKWYLSPLAASIPLKLTMTLKQNDKLSSLILNLRSVTELDLEPIKNLNDKMIDKDNNFDSSTTTFIILNEKNNVWLNVSKNVSSNCSNDDTLHVYELLNSNGINFLKGKELELSQNKDSNLIIKDNKIKSEAYSQNSSINNDKITNNALFPDRDIREIVSSEYLVRINHRYLKMTYPYLFHKVQFYPLGFMPDYLLWNNSIANFTSLNLYDYIWEKYSYVLPSSSKSLIWWEKTSQTKQGCYPFVLKLIDAQKGNCFFCPWFKLCQGCIIRPSNNTVFISPKSSIVVEWCYKLIKSGQIFTNITLILSYDYNKPQDKQSLSKSTNLSNEIKQKSIYQCIDLCFQSETLDDPLMCQTCKVKTLHSKIDKIVKLPKYLVLTLKRFNQMDYASNIKNNTLIEFPMKDFVINEKSYDLYGAIYHSGSENSGHYYTIIKAPNDKWVSLNDKKVTLIDDERSIVSHQAYILIYEENSKGEPSLYHKLIESMLNNWESRDMDDFVFDGEPVKVNEAFGVVKKSFFKNGNYVVKVLFDNEEQNVKIEEVQGFVDYYTKKIWKKEKELYQKDDSICFIF